MPSPTKLTMNKRKHKRHTTESQNEQTAENVQTDTQNTLN